MLQKVIKIGNSAAVTIPTAVLKKSGLKVGDEVFVQTNGGSELMTVFRDKKAVRNVSSDFLARAEKFISKNKKLLERLAKEE